MPHARFCPGRPKEIAHTARSRTAWRAASRVSAECVPASVTRVITSIDAETRRPYLTVLPSSTGWEVAHMAHHHLPATMQVRMVVSDTMDTSGYFADREAFIRSLGLDPDDDDVWATPDYDLGFRQSGTDDADLDYHPEAPTTDPHGRRYTPRCDDCLTNPRRRGRRCDFCRHKRNRRTESPKT